MNTLLADYRGVTITDAGPYRADSRHPLVVTGTHQLELRRAGGGVVDRILFQPTAKGRADALATAISRVDWYGQRGFSWVSGGRKKS